MDTQFNQTLASELTLFLESEQFIFPKHEEVHIDLHCHDYNSNIPDELLGRILNVPETWLPTDKLIQSLARNGSDAFTITNHNNARSCFELLDKGLDVLVGAEFSCTVPDFDTGIHVLTYGFSPDQELKLNKLRKNLYSFLEYTAAENIPTTWAHPLYYYKSSGSPPLVFFDKLALLFERFEVLNGQRDTWQNLLVKHWIDTLNEDKLQKLSQSFGINPEQYCRNPIKKSYSGGSDSHMGIFCGMTGTRLYVPGLSERKKSEPLSSLCLEAIREGRMAPYGNHHHSERMTVTFLDYFSQIALNGKDPGLMRLILHKGSLNQKMIAMLVSNGFAELRRHKVTMNFIQLFHESLTGQAPHFTKRWFVPKVYKPVFDEVTGIAHHYNEQKTELASVYQESISAIFSNLMKVLSDRLSIKLQVLGKEHKLQDIDLAGLLEKLELPSELRSFLNDGKKTTTFADSSMKVPDIASFLDGLSFPFLASTVILSAHFTSSHVLYKSRELLNDFSEALGKLKHPKRMLWLTDTYDDANGVSTVLKSILKHIQLNNLPIDILVCGNHVKSEDHLVVIKPINEFVLPFYKQQRFRIPNFLELNTVFQKGEYDRVMCSTEGVMGLAALYLKYAYTIPAFFYIHTDWITFVKKVLTLDKASNDRVKRIIRAYYKLFDKLFVLNTDQKLWLTGKKMEFRESSVCNTAHWAEPCFYKRDVSKAETLLLEPESKVLLYAGRLSKEKGVLELPEIFETLKLEFPFLKLIIVGTGPAEEELKVKIPDAGFYGWKDHESLAKIYSCSDLLLLPSKFDTFSCVVLEALSCELPVVAYNTKGPKDILTHGVNGFLVRTTHGFINAIAEYLRQPEMHANLRKSALERSKDYSSTQIMDKLMIDVGLIKSDNSDYGIPAFE